MDDTTNEAPARPAPETMVRLYRVKMVREALVAAVDEDDALQRAEDLANLDPNDLAMEEPRDLADDVTAEALAAVGTTSRMLGLVPEGENPRRLTVAKLIKAGLVESEAAE